jgi:hypothetical protein
VAFFAAFVSVCRALAIVAFGIVALAPASTYAYVRTKTSEAQLPVFWNVPQQTVLVHVGDPPPDIGAEEILRATLAAASVWSHNTLLCTRVNLQIKAVEEENGQAGVDGVNRIVFRRDAWPYSDAAALALTSVFAHVPTGKILEADMEINAVGFTWADLVEGDSRPTVHDLQNTLTHEFGHFIGLDHTCYLARQNQEDRPRPVDIDGNEVPDCADAPEEVRETIMFPSVAVGDTSRRALNPDEMRAACEIYPAFERPLSGEIGCSVERRRPRGYGSLVLVIVAVFVAVFGLAFSRRRATPWRAKPSSTNRQHVSPGGVPPDRC